MNAVDDTRDSDTVPFVDQRRGSEKEKWQLHKQFTPNERSKPDGEISHKRISVGDDVPGGDLLEGLWVVLTKDRLQIHHQRDRNMGHEIEEEQISQPLIHSCGYFLVN
jgi:hypothetical protein